MKAESGTFSLVKFLFHTPILGMYEVDAMIWVSLHSFREEMMNQADRYDKLILSDWELTDNISTSFDLQRIQTMAFLNIFNHAILIN